MAGKSRFDLWNSCRIGRTMTSERNEAKIKVATTVMRSAMKTINKLTLNTEITVPLGE